MTHAVPPRAVRPLEVRSLEARDVEAATALAAQVFASGAEEPDFAAELHRKFARAWVALEGEQLLGYALGWLVLDEAELMSIAVAPEARGRGVARVLLRRFLDEVAREGAHSVVLEVRASNAAARALYAKFGFALLDTRRAYYADGEDALSHRLLLP